MSADLRPSCSLFFVFFFVSPPNSLVYIILYTYIILRRFFSSSSSSSLSSSSSSSSSSYYYYPRNGGPWRRYNRVGFIPRFLQYLLLLLLLLYLHGRLPRGPPARRMFSRAAVTREPCLVSCLQYVQSRRNHMRRRVFGALGERKNFSLRFSLMVRYFFFQITK